MLAMVKSGDWASLTSWYNCRSLRWQWAWLSSVDTFSSKEFVALQKAWWLPLCVLLLSWMAC